MLLDKLNQTKEEIWEVKFGYVPLNKLKINETYEVRCESGLSLDEPWFFDVMKYKPRNLTLIAKELDQKLDASIYIFNDRQAPSDHWQRLKADAYGDWWVAFKV